MLAPVVMGSYNEEIEIELKTTKQNRNHKKSEPY